MKKVNKHSGYGKIIADLKNDKISGINVTVPFKKMVIPYCDKLIKQLKRNL